MEVAGIAGVGVVAEGRDVARQVHRIFVFSQAVNVEGVCGVVAGVTGD